MENSDKVQENKKYKDIIPQERQSIKEDIRYDTDIYTTEQDKDEYNTTIVIKSSNEKSKDKPVARQRFNYSAPKEVYEDFEDENDQSIEPIEDKKDKRIISKRENEYQARRHNRELPPERKDPFSLENKDGQAEYKNLVRGNELMKEEKELKQKISKMQSETLENATERAYKRRKWDVKSPEHIGDTSSIKTDETLVKNESSAWEDDNTSKTVSQFEATPKIVPSETPKRTISKWDQTPQIINAQTPSIANFATPTPVGNMGMMTPNQVNLMKLASDIDIRNKPLTDEELDELLPKNGYRILEPPLSYVPIRTPARKLTATPTPYVGTQGFSIQETQQAEIEPEIPTDIPGIGTLPYFKQDDMQYFGKLLQPGLIEKQEELDIEELKEIKIMQLLLKIKNGTPQMRKSAIRHLTNNARELGASNLFNQILPLLMSPSLEDQERHLLVKVIDRIMFQLDDLVRPFTHKILVVIEPMLIDEDLYARIEGREIISNLSKAVGLATMISTMRPDIDHVDEYVRNTTARAFAVVASALGIPSLLPFLKAVCRSKKSWQARHTGIKIIQQISILMGCAVLPHLRRIVDIICLNLEDEQLKVRIMSALCISALAEASYPYGIEAFEPVLNPLWTGIRKHRGKGLAAFLKAIGCIIPLMDPENANYYTKEVMIILKREFRSPDDEMKKIVLKVIKQCCDTEGVSQKYLEDEVLPDFFKYFWIRRMALDRRNYRQLVETTVEIAKKVGGSLVISKIITDIKDESELYRKMVIETIEKIILELGCADIDKRLEQILVDGMLYAFQEQSSDDFIVLRGLGSVFNALESRAKSYLPQACSIILWRLNNRSSRVRQQSADLVSKIANILHICNEEKLMSHLGLVLYECLGEEYPEVLGSILLALKGIVSVIGITAMNPPIKDLLPRLTPILKNRHEKVQECSIELVGTIAERGAEFVSAREWMRICFDMLEMFKAQKKSIRRNAMHTFGYIAKAIGPQDVLATLLNNLKVQERQNRLCTTIAIAIVADQCQPFTVLPALMNEYRVPELNVQNGVLKALSFLFEYVGEIGKDYIDSVTPLLEDALMDRDLVHRQIACSTIKHLALCCFSSNCEETLVHLLNFVWPNIFENAPHMITAVREAVEGLCVSLGSARILQYLLQGLFHPARMVREVYWRMYNCIYIYNPQALVPAYPKIKNDGRNTYERYELEYFI